MTGKRIEGAVGLVSPPLAVIAVWTAGAATPGYSAATFTISQLAVSGAPNAGTVQAAMCLTATGCLALALAVTRIRLPLMLSAAGLVLAALIRLDPASPAWTAGHRVFTGLAVIGFVAAPIAYGRGSFAIAVAEALLLVSGLALLDTQFDGWGVWERCFFALPLGWMMLVSLRVLRTERTIVSTDDAKRLAAASSSRTA